MLWTCPHEVINIEIATVSSAVAWGGAGGAGPGCVRVYKEELGFSSAKPQH